MVNIVVKMVKKHSTAGIDGPEMGARIKAIREMAGLSQERFAQILGYTRRQVVAWETAANGPPIAILPTIRKIFDIDPEWVVMGPGRKPMRKVGQEELDRRQRIKEAVLAFAKDKELNLSQATTAKLVQMIIKRQVADEAAVLEVVFEVLQNVADGSN
jgi:transcriptional regulator with XRE-family HTH domain